MQPLGRTESGLFRAVNAGGESVTACYTADDSLGCVQVEAQGERGGATLTS